MSEGDFWCAYLPRDGHLPHQGWKLHVSATPLSCAAVLARALPVLLRARCAFKFARTTEGVALLTSSKADRVGGGKFITVYPARNVRELALELDEATREFSGPAVLSDRAVRSGGIVHYRYGVFTGRSAVGRSGGRRSFLLDPQGRQVEDSPKPYFTCPDWARDPFETSERMRSRPAETPSAVHLAGRFRVSRALRQSYRGGVYAAHDESTGRQVVVKQARPHVDCGPDGTDARDLLRHEAEMCEALSVHGLAPRVVRVFEQQGDLFLAREHVPGETLERWAQRRTDTQQAQALPLAAALATAETLTAMMSAVHEQGFVLRDFKPSNIVRRPDGELRLIDLEHAHRSGTTAQRAVFSPGFTAPEQDLPAGSAPARTCVASDLFSLGMTILFAVTAAPLWHSCPRDGADTSETLAANVRRLLDGIGATEPAVRHLTPLIAGLTHLDPEQRWDARQALRHLRGDGPDADRRRPAPTRSPRAARAAEPDPGRMAADGVRHLLRAVRHIGEGGRTRDTDAAELSAGTGAAGALRVLSRVAATSGDTPMLRAAGGLARALLPARPGTPHAPGLFDGHAGGIWATYDVGRQLDDQSLRTAAAEALVPPPSDGEDADVYRGLAGSGLATLHLWQTSHDPRLLQALTARADAVREKVARQASAGFAHGRAGMSAFLLEAGHATGSSAYWDTALAHADELARTARSRVPGIWWSADATRPHVGWCNGAAGIAGFLARAGELAGRDDWVDLARQAADAAVALRWQQASTACCGLAGLGEFLLDLERTTQDGTHRAAAESLAAVLRSRRAGDGVVITGASRTTSRPPVGFSHGASGIVAFLWRLAHGGDGWWSPGAPNRSGVPAGGAGAYAR
ncbi:class IV lanthionine synthetase LanL [Streptomyces sp. NPDC048514]|uniref:class IV lanthionine synthetase LanL n=1 Tax=Streptomyces sp. NPDC048514 TaxID=3365564 RepID=UPI00371FE686